MAKVPVRLTHLLTVSPDFNIALHREKGYGEEREAHRFKHCTEENVTPPLPFLLIYLETAETDMLILRKKLTAKAVLRRIPTVTGPATTPSTAQAAWVSRDRPFRAGGLAYECGAMGPDGESTLGSY